MDDKKYKVMVAGSGFMGNVHGEAYKRIENVEISKIYDISAKRGKEYAEKFDCVWADDLEKAFDDIDFVDVCLPTLFHKDIVLSAFDRGKDVLCEKPISLDVGEAEEMKKASEDKQRLFMIAHVVRFWPEYAKAAKMIQDGQIKDILNITFSRYGPPPTWSVGNWMLTDEKSGGIIYDLIIHDVDFAMWMFGVPKWVYAKRTMIGPRYTAYINVILGYEKINVLVEGGFDMPSKYPYTTGFRLTTGDTALEYINKNRKGLLYYNNNEADGIKLEYDDYDPYEKEIRYFLECLENNQKPEICKPQEAVDLLNVLKKIELSAKRLERIDIADSVKGSAFNARKQ